MKVFDGSAEITAVENFMGVFIDTLNNKTNIRLNFMYDT